MNATNLFAVHFLARPIKLSPTEAILYVRISVGRKRLELSLRKKIPVEFWDVKKGLVKCPKMMMQELNPYLQDIRYQLMECVRQLNMEKKKLTPEAIKRRFLGEESDRTLCGLMRYHNENSQNGAVARHAQKLLYHRAVSEAVPGAKAQCQRHSPCRAELPVHY